MGTMQGSLSSPQVHAGLPVPQVQVQVQAQVQEQVQEQMQA